MRGVLLLPVALAAVVLASGCTIPGTDIEIPIPFLGGGQEVVEYKDDIIIIKSLQVTPGTEVKPGQALTLYADIQNIQETMAGGEKVSATVELYDYCLNMFSVEGENPETIDMQPREISSVEWVLTPKADIKLKTPCTLKVKVTYHYTTRVVTQITFVDENELNSRVRRGESWRISGSSVIGYGPVKPYLTVESQQPISENVNGFISLTIKNVGNGFVKNSKIGNDVKIEEEKLKIELAKEGGGGCVFKAPIDLINKQSYPLMCTVKPPGDISIEQTYDMKAEVEYDYEFRKDIRVTVNP
jgi:hypothetical protein